MLFAVMDDNTGMSEPHVVRRANLLSLYTAHVAHAQAHNPAASLAGIDKEFAARIQIANSSFSSYKSGARPIGTRIARQVESLLELEPGWLDVPHGGPNLASEDKALRQFLKLAERAYKRANETQRGMLSDVLKMAMAATDRG